MPDQIRSTRLLSGSVASGVSLINSHRTPNSGILQQGLIYHLDAGNPLSYPGTGTTWTDLSSSGTNATLVNGTSFSPTFNGTMVLDGTDDYTESSLVTSSTTSVTMQAWVFIPSTSIKGCFIANGRGNGYAIGVGTGGFDTPGNTLLMLFPNVRWINTGVSLGTGWMMITMRMSAASVPAAFVNARTIGGFSGSNPNAPSTATYIGRTIGDEPVGSRAFQGNVAMVMIYNRLLVLQEISHNFNATKARFGL